jgi:hypothetical protein
MNQNQSNPVLGSIKVVKEIGTLKNAVGSTHHDFSLAIRIQRKEPMINLIYPHVYSIEVPF